MKIAIPVWEGRISPVLDAADRILVVETRDDAVVSKRFFHIGGLNWLDKARAIKQQAGILICGALTKPLEEYLLSLGVVLHPWVMGNAEEIVEMYSNGTVPGPECKMPGCRIRRYGQQACRKGNDIRRGSGRPGARRWNNLKEGE